MKNKNTVSITAKDVIIEEVSVRIFSDNSFCLSGTRVFSTDEPDISRAVAELIRAVARAKLKDNK